MEKMPEKYYLITKDELVGLMPTYSSVKAMKIMVEVLARPYKEMSAGAVLAGSAGRGLSALGKGAAALGGAAVNALERASETDKKRGK